MMITSLYAYFLEELCQKDMNPILKRKEEQLTEEAQLSLILKQELIMVEALLIPEELMVVTLTPVVVMSSPHTGAPMAEEMEVQIMDMVDHRMKGRMK